MSWLLFVALVSKLLTSAGSTSKRVAVVVDTSTSMQSADSYRYGVLLPQVISDLLGLKDAMAVVRFPHDQDSCGSGVDLSLLRTIDKNNRSISKSDLDWFLAYNTGTYFTSAVQTAINFIGFDKDIPRLILLLVDSGGFSECESSALLPKLRNLRSSGVTTAVVNLDSDSGAFASYVRAFSVIRSARNPQEFIDAVASIYQEFLGSNSIRKADSGPIEFELSPGVREAFVIVMADSHILLSSDAGNPGAEKVDLSYRGGGSVVGLDGIRRAYKIARLVRPQNGAWQFNRTASASSAWTIIIDSALGFRILAQGPFVSGHKQKINVQLVNEETGEPIRNLQPDSKLELTMRVDGEEIVFAPTNYTEAIFQGTINPRDKGRKDLSFEITTDNIKKTRSAAIDIVQVAWRIVVSELNESPVVNKKVLLQAELRGLGAGRAVEPPNELWIPELQIRLRDDGIDGDRIANDNVFGGIWVPSKIGPESFNIEPAEVGQNIASAVVKTEVIGELQLQGARIKFGSLSSGETATNTLDLRGSQIKGQFKLEATSNWNDTAIVFELFDGEKWLRLGQTGSKITVSDSSSLVWPLRVRVGRCPCDTSATSLGIQLRAWGSGIEEQEIVLPLRLMILEDAWLQCWWEFVVVVLVVILLVFFFYGYIYPSHFPLRFGVQMSDRLDVSEGFFHPIRGTRGVGIGLYRNAECYICSDYRLSSRSRGGLVRLRAGGVEVYIQPVRGQRMMRQSVDGSWEPLSSSEVPVRYGVIYRNEDKTIFFEFRNI